MLFSELGLRAEILRSLSEQGYDSPTPIQEKAIPQVLAGHDLMAAAQTGTGKTAGFTLPMLQLLSTRDAPGTAAQTKFRTRCLILTPTRELAAQVYESVRTYGQYLNLRAAAIYGGVSMVPQTKLLRAGVEIIVATPGRLLDHVTQRNVDLSGIEMVVLDEADGAFEQRDEHPHRERADLAHRQRVRLLNKRNSSSEKPRSPCAAGVFCCRYAHFIAARHAALTMHVAIATAPPQRISARAFLA